MSEPWYLTAIDEIEKSNRLLTDWERGFLYGSGNGRPGIKDRARAGLSLTKKQEGCLLRIHRRMMGLETRRER